MKERRKEIEEIHDNKLLNNDMLTLLIIANTEIDIKENYSKSNEERFSRPMTDQEIMSVILDSFIGGSDTTCVSLFIVSQKILKF